MKLSAEYCRQRQQSLVAVLDRKKLDCALISERRYVYYFTGLLTDPLFSAAAVIDRKGKVTLIAPTGTSELDACDDFIPFPPSFRCTMHSRQWEVIAEKAMPLLANRRYGCDPGAAATLIAAANQIPNVLGDELCILRRQKFPDEILAIRDAIRITDVMYDTARQVLAPGVDEMDVYAEIHAAAVRAAGRDLDYFGNDFQANARGGRPRRRKMNASELYILDAGPVIDGYFADNCRTFAVNGEPTAEQTAAWQTLDVLFPILEQAISPGIPATDIFNLADAELRRAGYEGLDHHLGHGIGIHPHEAPELNPEYNARFEPGNVFTMEPGIYRDSLHAGIRLEENYLLHNDGSLERLTHYSRSLN